MLENIATNLPYSDSILNLMPHFLKYHIDQLSSNQVAQIYSKSQRNVNVSLDLISIIAPSQHFQTLKNDILQLLNKYEGSVDKWITSLQSLNSEDAIECALNGLEIETTKGHTTKDGIKLCGWRELAKIMFFLSTIQWNSQFTKRTLQLMSAVFEKHQSPLAYSSAKLLVNMQLEQNELVAFLEPLAVSNSSKLLIAIYRELKCAPVRKLVEYISEHSKTGPVAEAAHRALKDVC